MRSSSVVILSRGDNGEGAQRRKREGGDPGSGGANTSGDSGADRPGNPTGHHRWGDGGEGPSRRAEERGSGDVTAATDPPVAAATGSGRRMATSLPAGMTATSQWGVCG